jgi:IS5 family transposase
MEKQPSPADEMLAQAAAQAVETDPVLSELDRVLDADPLYQQVCVKLDGLGTGATPLGEVLLRLLLVKYLYDWSEQQTAEQVEDSLVLRWFCRLGLQQAPSESLVSQAAGHVSVAELEALANRVEQASERAKESEGRLRPTYRQRWR